MDWGVSFVVSQILGSLEYREQNKLREEERRRKDRECQARCKARRTPEEIEAEKAKRRKNWHEKRLNTKRQPKGNKQ